MKIKNHTDANGLPDGGYVVGIGLSIEWQNGPLGDGENPIRNGALLEDVLEACKQRLEHFQRGPTACRESAQAAKCVEYALSALERRESRRRDQGVLGRHEESGDFVPGDQRWALVTVGPGDEPVSDDELATIAGLAVDAVAEIESEVDPLTEAFTFESGDEGDL